MKHIKLISLFCFLSGVLFFPPTSLADQTGGTVVQFGDSLTVGMVQHGLEDKYKAAGLNPIIPGNNPDGSGNCNDGYKAGYPCKGVQTIIDAVDSNKDRLNSANAVVIEMGTNMTEGSASAFKSAMEQLIDKIHQINGNAKIYWVNLSAKTPAKLAAYSERNKTISDVVAEKNITLVDWFHKISPGGDPQNMQPDTIDPNNWINDPSLGVHMNEAGYQAMADTIVSAITTSDAGGPGGSPGASGSSSDVVSCFTSTVGSPIGPPPPLPAECPAPGSTTSNNELVKIAQDIKVAYTDCGHERDDDTGGFTYANIPNLTTCLQKDLKDAGYSDDDIDIFTARKVTSIAGGCTQCLGYVGEVVALLTKDTSSLTGYETAAQVDAPSSFTYGGSTWKKIDASTEIQPGDIGVSTAGSAGHIVIVKEVTDNGTHFIALESNAAETCRVTDDRKTPRENYQDFFRKQ